MKTFKWCTYLSQRIFSTQKTRYSLLIWKQPIRFEKQMPFSQICCQIIEGLFLDNHKEINFSSRSIFRFNSNSNSIQLQCRVDFIEKHFLSFLQNRFHQHEVKKMLRTKERCKLIHELGMYFVKIFVCLCIVCAVN